MMLQVFHGEPGFWNKAYGSKPNPAPVYGRAKSRNGDLLDLDQEVIVHRGYGLEPVRGKVVAIGDEGLPDRNLVRYRPYGSAVLSAANSEQCEVHEFDDYEWLRAETEAAAVMVKKGLDLARCMFGGFDFERYQREVMKVYLNACA